LSAEFLITPLFCHALVSIGFNSIESNFNNLP